MKRTLLLSMAMAFVMGCASSHYSMRTRNPAGVPFLGHSVVVVGNREFSQLEDLKAFVRTLPPGTVLTWNTGLVGYDRIPFPHSDMTLEAFGEYCRQYKVKFRIATGWGQILVTRAYPLRSPAFKQFIEIVSSPAITEPRTRKAFAECGMPYADNLRTWFADLGVPFGTGATVSYDAEGGQLIVQNTRTSQALVSDIVAWCNAREFEQKVQCLKSHLPGGHP